MFELFSRVEALCKSLGHLWLDSDVIEVKDGISEEKLTECKANSVWQTLF